MFLKSFSLLFVVLIWLIEDGCRCHPVKKCLFNEDMVKCMSDNLQAHGMDRVFLTGSGAPTCNDGTPSGYYIRSNPESTQWIIYIEGGWFCSDPKTCSRRRTEDSFSTIMSSRSWKEKRLGDGLLSVDQTENSEFWQANHVYIPYCSSDFWVGNTITYGIDGSKIAFHGSRIITEVVTQLLGKGLKSAHRLIMSGSSAGGIGVLQNIDRISAFLARNTENKIDVRGLVDSAWVLDVPVVEGCDDCNPNMVFKRAVKYWNARLNTKCALAYKDEKHKCLFAANTFKFIEKPIFVFQWLLDTVQIMTENSYMFNLNEDYLKDLRSRMKTSLKSSIVNRKHAIYAPTCVSHTGLATAASMFSITIKESTLNQAVKCWLTIGNCRKRLVDPCEGLTCHDHNCPAITHPLTGKVITNPMNKKEKRGNLVDLSDRAIRKYLELLKGLQVYDSDTEKGKV